MNDVPQPRRKWARVALRAAAGLVVIAVALAAIVHAPPVRRFALRRAAVLLDESFGIRLEADRLDYNLFKLRVAVTGLRVAAAHAQDRPFFEAARAEVRLPPIGTHGFPFQDESVQIDAIEVDRGRILIRRAADGTTNLPAAAEESEEEGEPAALRIGTVTARGMDIEFSDEGSRTSLRLPALDVVLGGADRIDLRTPGTLTRADVTTTIHELAGGLAFDGREVRLSALTLRTDELTADLDGTVALLVAEPGVNARLGVRADAAGLARWGGVADHVAGALALDAAVKGPFASPVAEARLRSARVEWQQVAVTDLLVAAALAGDRLRLDTVEARVAGGRVTASGDVPLGEGDSRVSAAWSDLDVGTLAALAGLEAEPRPSGRLSGRVEGHGPALDFPQWTLAVDTQIAGGAAGATGLALDGNAAVTLERGRWSLTADPAVAGIRVVADLGGLADFDAPARSTVAGRVTIPTASIAELAAAARGAGVALGEFDDRVGRTEGTLRADATISGTFGRPAVRFEGEGHVVDVSTLAPGTPLEGSAHARFDGDLDQVRLAAELPALNVLAAATVVPRAPYAATVEVTAGAVEIERLVRGVELPLPLRGMVEASARASGEIDRWRDAEAAVEVTRLDATAGELPVALAAPLRLEYGSGVFSVRSMEVVAGELRISALGGLPLAEGESDGAPSLIATLNGDLAQIMAAVAATRLVELPDVKGTGPAALLARVAGSVERPRVAADLELGPGTVAVGEYPAASGVHLRAHSDGEWIELRALAAEWQGSRIAASGRAPVAMLDAKSGEPGPRPRAELDARVTSITPDLLAPFVDADTVAQFAGSVDATVRAETASTSLDDVVAEIRLDRMDLRIADLAIEQREPTRISLRDGSARIEAWQWTGPGGTLDVRGRIGLTDRQAALLANGRFDLRMLTPFVREAGLSTAGVLEPRLSVTGSLDDPRIDGVASLVDVELRLADPRVIATGVNGQVLLSRTRAELTTLNGTLNGGTLGGTGVVEYGQDRPLDASFALEVNGMAIEFPEGLRSELNAALGLSVNAPPGGAAPSGAVTGTVTVVRSAYREPITVATSLLAGLRSRQAALEATPAGPSFADRLTLNVRVVTEEDVIVDNNLGRLQLGGDLRVLGTAGAPVLGGRAMLREGGRLFLGRNVYTIDSGTIDFANPETVQPELDIAAHTRAGGEDITLTLRGTPEAPEVELRSPSTPELGQADLASLLLTGRRLEEFGGSEADIAGEQALAYLSGDVLGFAGRAVGLDTVRLGGVQDSTINRDPSAIATDVDPTSRLTFGRSIGSNVDLLLSQSLRDSDAQTWILEYRPRRRVEVRFISDDEDLRAYQFRHDVTFGQTSVGAPAAGARPRRREARVGSVEIAGASALAESRVRGVLKLEAGDEFDFADWQQDRDRVEELYHREGYYEVRISAAREGEAEVALTYAIEEGPRTSIDVSGYSLSREALASMRRAWTTSVFDDFLREEAAEIARSALMRDGFLEAKVLAAFRQAGETKTLVVTIDPGARVAGLRLQITGADETLTAELEDWAGARNGARQAIESPRGFESAAAAWLRGRGHLAAAVRAGAPVIGDREAVIPVKVDAGPRYVVRDVRIAGVERLESETVRDVLDLPAGAPYDPAAMESARERLVGRYRREGFPSSRVTLEPAIDRAAQAVDVAVTVAEGPRQVVAEVDVQGNRAIDTDVIARAVALTAGEPLSTDALLQARRRIFATGLFRRVDVTPEAMEPVAASPEALPMRARVTVQEWPALRLRYGFVVAEERPEGEVDGRELVPGLAADLTRRTLFGRAITVGAAFDYQRLERRVRGFASTSTLFSWPIESSLVVERGRQEFKAATLVTDKTGASWEQRFRFTPNLRVSYALRFERNRTFDSAPTDPTVPIFDVVINVGRLNTAVAYDTRDDPADTRRGVLMSSSFDYAPATLGSSIRFVRYLGQAYYFRPWRGLVFGSALRIGAAAALDGQELIFSERFLAGGARSMRGVTEDGLGPQDFFGDAVGGESVVILNQEARFPLFWWFRGVGFLDAGNVFERASGIDFGGLRGAYGAGLRVDTPFALLRADYGRLFSPRSAERGGRWFFGLGHAF